MKPADLMIGDYILYNGEIARVTSLSENIGEFRHGVTDTVVKEDSPSIEPIPITPDILEHSGFEWTNSTYTGIGRGHYGLVEEEELTHDGHSETFLKVISVYDSEQEAYGEYWSVEVNGGSIFGLKYVHQLQHALRLYGVKKDICVPNLSVINQKKYENDL